MIVPCPKCDHRFHVSVTIQPEKREVADYVVKYRGYDPALLQAKTDEYMAKHRYGQEELEICVEIPGSRRKV